MVYKYSEWSVATPFECTKAWHKMFKKFFSGARKYPAYCEDARPSLGHAIAQAVGCYPSFKGTGCAAIAMSIFQRNPVFGCPGAFLYPAYVWTPVQGQNCPIPQMYECGPAYQAEFAGVTPLYCGKSLAEAAMGHQEVLEHAPQSCITNGFKKKKCWKYARFSK